MEKQSPTAVITGATSGIGLEFARQLAKRGCDLIITGRRMDILKEEVERLELEYSVSVEVVKADFTHGEDVDSLCKRIRSLSRIDYFVNNAGFGHKAKFLDDQWEIQRTMLQVHVEALSAFSHCAGVAMRKQGFGAIINVSSVASFAPSPTSPLYSASKAYINSFSLSLDAALFSHGVVVQSLCPGFTRTDFHSKLNMESSRLRNRGLIRWMSARQVVALSLRHLGRTPVVYTPGFSNKMLVFFSKGMPTVLYRFIATKFFKKFKEKMK